MLPGHLIGTNVPSFVLEQRMGTRPPDALAGARTPLWGCKCGCWDKWASRIKFRQCGTKAPERIVKAAKAAVAAITRGPRPPQGKCSQGASANEDPHRLIADLQKHVSQLKSTAGGGGWAAPPQDMMAEHVCVCENLTVMFLEPGEQVLRLLYVC